MGSAAIRTSRRSFRGRTGCSARARPARRRADAATSARGCGTARWPTTSFRCAATSSVAQWEPGAGPLRLRARRGRRRARDPRGPGPCRHHRAGALPLPIVGEKVLRLEERLGYTHKGIERRFEALSLADGSARRARLRRFDRGVRVGLCAGAEALAGIEAPPRARGCARCARARAHREPPRRPGRARQRRGFGFALAQFMRLKEDGLRATRGLRPSLLMDCIVPGGVARRPRRDGSRAHRDAGARSPREVARCATSSTSTRGCRTASRPRARDPRARAQARATGLAGRASGQAFDLRGDLPVRALRRARACARFVAHCGRCRGAGRGALRRAAGSLRLIDAIVERDCPRATSRRRLPAPRDGLGVGWIEGWRGPVLVALEAGRTADPPLPCARSLVAELAGARARGDRQHRSRLPAHQQELQPDLLRARPVTLMIQILQKIARPAS